ncbi:MAG: hypothetical protein HYS83_02040 [Candidatus Blackburnbacteria bacterium]|nr:hypothetical protein [Candidatus Blackburnbacteria bacterium]
MREQKLTKALPFIFVFLLFFLPSIDTDLGWHLRYGKYFFNTGAWLRENEFTYFLADYRWINPFVLYEIMVASIYKLGGLAGLSLAFALLMASTFWFYNRMNPKLPLINLLAFLGAAALGWHVFALGMRAQVFSFFGVVVLLFILQKSVKYPKVIILLPVLFLLWANTHGGFALGLMLFLLAALDKVFKKNWEFAFFFGLAAAISGLAALINPYGIDIYKEALRHAQYPLDKLIAEWVPPSLESKVFIVITALIVVLLVINSSNKRKFFWISVSVLFAILTFKARRFMPYFGLTLALGIITSYEHWLLKAEQKVQKYAVPLLGTGSLILFLRIVPHTLDVDTDWKKYCTANQVKQPCRAVEFIRANPIPGKNVFSAYEWGGFLEWQLPQYKYFVDGRMPAWATSEGKSPYTVYLEIIQSQPGYQEKLDKYGTDWLLIGAGTFLDIELQSNSREQTAKNKGREWEETYRDNIAVIYTKSW